MSRLIKRGAGTETLPRWVPDAHGGPPAPSRPAGVVTPTTEPRGAGIDVSALERDAHERGFARGMAEVEEAYRGKLARLDALSASLESERVGFFDRIEPELVRLSVSIAEKVIGQELELRPEIVVGVVRSAVKRLRDREHLRVSVNPGDIERVKEAREDLISAVDGVRTMDIVEDRRVGAGGCVIESPSGTLDARIQTQIDEISRALGEANAVLSEAKDHQDHGDSQSHPVPESSESR